MMQPDKRITALVDAEGFMNAVSEQQRYYKTIPEAYLAVEEIYYKYYGKTRYSSFESFKQVRNRLIKKNKTK
jgi:hypothetical protein